MLPRRQVAELFGAARESVKEGNSAGVRDVKLFTMDGCGRCQCLLKPSFHVSCGDTTSRFINAFGLIQGTCVLVQTRHETPAESRACLADGLRRAAC